MAASSTTTMTTEKPIETNNAHVTTWIPMNSDFTVPADCSSRLWQVVPQTIAAWDPGYGVSVNKGLTCHPAPVTTWWLADARTSMTVSIGPLRCPGGYTTAASSSRNTESTMIACCPINYEFARFSDRGSTGECTSQVAAGDVLTYAVRDSKNNWITTSTTMSTASNVAGIQINGWVFATSTSTPTLLTVSPSGQPDASATASTSSAAASSSSNAIAVGVGVGVSLGVVSLIVFVVGLCMMLRARRKTFARRQEQQQQQQQQMMQMQQSPLPTHHMPMHPTDTYSPQQMTLTPPPQSSTPPYGHSHSHELGAEWSPRELPAVALK